MKSHCESNALQCNAFPVLAPVRPRVLPRSSLRFLGGRFLSICVSPPPPFHLYTLGRAINPPPGSPAPPPARMVHTGCRSVCVAET